MDRITITIEGGEAEDWVSLPRQLRHIHNQLGTLLDTLLEQGRHIMGLETEFGALAAAFTTLSTEIDTELQQLVDAVAAGNANATTVEDARTRINALTSSINEKVAALQADNPPAPGA